MLAVQRRTHRLPGLQVEGAHLFVDTAIAQLNNVTCMQTSKPSAAWPSPMRWSLQFIGSIA